MVVRKSRGRQASANGDVVSNVLRMQQINGYIERMEYGRFAETYNCIKTAFHDTDILATSRPGEKLAVGPTLSPMQHDKR